MKLQWTSKGLSDLVRVHDFFAAVNGPAADRTVKTLTAGASKLLRNPCIGERLDEFTPREVRKLIIDRYELRYEILGDTILILRLWHTREQR